MKVTSSIIQFSKIVQKHRLNEGLDFIAFYIIEELDSNKICKYYIRGTCLCLLHTRTYHCYHVEPYILSISGYTDL